MPSDNSDPRVVLVSRSETIDSLIRDCAEGNLAFSGPDSLCAKVAAMGYNTNSLYEMVTAVERSIPRK